MRRVGLLAGTVASAPLMASWLTGCQSAASWQPVTLTLAQADRLAALAEVILPATETPGARDARVHQFIDVLVTEVLPPRVRQAFLDGLDGAGTRAQEAYGAAFTDLTPEQQTALVQAMADEAVASYEQRRLEDDEPVRYYSMLNLPTGPDEPAPFFVMLKEATLLGYYTSQVGATQELLYAAVPGRYEGNVPYPSDAVDRTWAL